jgi:predicted dienelactone hydrolase
MAIKHLLATIAVGFVSLSGCGNDGGQPLMCTTCPARYPVGYRELTINETARGRTLRTAIWYPSTEGERNAGRAFDRGAPNPTGRPYPLILFSHGDHARSTDGQTNFLINAWASRGFVVAAPDHAKNTSYDFDDSDANRAAIQFDRPVDISFVTDQMLSLNQDPASFLHGMIDPEAIGMSGASFGGHTTMTVSGATPNLDYLAEYCQTNPDNWDICPLQDEIQRLFPGQRVIDQSDPRMKAALGLAPDGYGWFREEGMAKIKIPMMIMGGRKDTICPLATQQQPMYTSLGSTKYLLILNDADHFAYMNGCHWWDWDMLPGCSALHAAILPASIAFWMLHLKGDPGCGDLLRTCVPLLPGVELLSTTADAGMPAPPPTSEPR